MQWIDGLAVLRSRRLGILASVGGFAWGLAVVSGSVHAAQPQPSPASVGSKAPVAPNPPLPAVRRAVSRTAPQPRVLPEPVPFSTFPGRETSHALVLDQSTTYTLPPAGTGLWNSRILLTNTGSTDIVNPFVVVNGTRDWYDTPSIVRDIVARAKTREEIPYRAWEFLSVHTYHAHTPDPGIEVHDPVRFLHSYGYGLCDDHAANLEVLWRAAGFTEARSANVGAHVVSEVKLGDHWRMMDANLEMIYPSQRHPGLASVAELLEDRTYLQLVSGNFSGIYSTTSAIYFQAPVVTTTTMAIRLRPGESLERAWYNWGKFHSLTSKRAPEVYGNGRLYFAPTVDQIESGITSVTRVGLLRGGLGFLSDDPGTSVPVSAHPPQPTTVAGASVGSGIPASPNLSSTVTLGLTRSYRPSPSHPNPGSPSSPAVAAEVARQGGRLPAGSVPIPTARPVRNSALLTSRLNLTLAAPYPMVGGVLEVPIRRDGGQGTVRVTMRRPDYRNYSRSQQFVATSQTQVIRVSLEDWVMPLRTNACYHLDLEISLGAGVSIGAPRAMVDLQCAPVALPGLDLDSTSTVAVRFDNPGGKGKLVVDHRFTPDGHLVSTHLPGFIHPLTDSSWPIWSRPLQVPIFAQAPGALTPPWISAWQSLLCDVDTHKILEDSPSLADFVSSMVQLVSVCQEGTVSAPPPFREIRMSGDDADL